MLIISCWLMVLLSSYVFLLIWSSISVKCWEEGDELSNYNCEVVYFFLSVLSSFTSHIFQLCYLVLVP